MYHRPHKWCHKLSSISNLKLKASWNEIVECERGENDTTKFSPPNANAKFLYFYPEVNCCYSWGPSSFRRMFFEFTLKSIFPFAYRRINNDIKWWDSMKGKQTVHDLPLLFNPSYLHFHLLISLWRPNSKIFNFSLFYYRWVYIH